MRVCWSSCPSSTFDVRCSCFSYLLSMFHHVSSYFVQACLQRVFNSFLDHRFQELCGRCSYIIGFNQFLLCILCLRLPLYDVCLPCCCCSLSRGTFRLVAAILEVVEVCCCCAAAWRDCNLEPVLTFSRYLSITWRAPSFRPFRVLKCPLCVLWFLRIMCCISGGARSRPFSVLCHWCWNRKYRKGVLNICCNGVQIPCVVHPLLCWKRQSHHCFPLCAGQPPPS